MKIAKATVNGLSTT